MLLKCLSFNFNSLDQAASEQQPSNSLSESQPQRKLVSSLQSILACLSLCLCLLAASCVLIKWYFINSFSRSQRRQRRRRLRLNICSDCCWRGIALKSPPLWNCLSCCKFVAHKFRSFVYSEISLENFPLVGEILTCSSKGFERCQLGLFFCAATLADLRQI